MGGSDQQAADAAGVTRPTVVLWRAQLPSFADAIRIARSELLKRTSARLHAATAIAVKALEEVARDTKNPSARVSAARAILELSHKSLELEDLQLRIEELEEWFESQKEGNRR